MKIKKDLYEELIKIKRQKKGISSYLLKNGYSKSYINSISSNWETLEVIGGPVNISTKKKVVKKAIVKKITSKSKKKNISVPPPLPQFLTSATEIKEVLDTVQPESQKELVLNISEGLEVKAEVRVTQLAHPRFFLGSLVKILQKTGAKVTFNAGLDLNNANENLSGFTLAINEEH